MATGEIQGHLVVRYQQTYAAGGIAAGLLTSPVGGGAVSYWLGNGTYSTFGAAGTELEDSLDDAVGGAGTWTVTWTGSVWTVERADNAEFDITFAEPLQRWFGFAASYGARADRTIATATAGPGFWLRPTYHFDNPDVSYEHRRYYREPQYSEPSGAKLSTRTFLRLGLYYLASEAAQVASLRAYLRTGAPCRVFLNTGDTTAWSETNRDGRMDVRYTEDTTEIAYASDPCTEVGRIQWDRLLVVG